MGREPAEDLDAVDAGQHQVEDDEVGRAVLGRAQGSRTVRGAVDVEAGVAQVAVDDLGDEGIVIDDEDAGHAATIGRSALTRVARPERSPLRNVTRAVEQAAARRGHSSFRKDRS